MAQIKLEVAPGIVRDKTEYSAMGRWIDGSNVRFVNGNVRRIGGYVHRGANGVLSGDTMGGYPSAIMSWNVAGFDNVLIGTTSGIYHFRYTEVSNSDVNDLTPSNFSHVFPGSLSNDLYWTFAKFGDDVLCLPKQGPLYILKSTQTSLAPDSLTFSEVKDETGAEEVPQFGSHLLYNGVTGHILIGGASAQDTTLDKEATGDIQNARVRWSDPNTFDFNELDPNNRAGHLDMPKGSFITAMQQDIDGRVLVSTDKAMYLLTPTEATLNGTPVVFSLTEVGEGCPAISPKSMILVKDVIYWLSETGVWAWRGTLEKVSSTLTKDFLINELITTVLDREKIFATHVTGDDYNEVRWHYPSQDNTHLRPSQIARTDKYIGLNYGTGDWSRGTFDVTCWNDGAFSHPIAVTSNRNFGEYEQLSSNATHFDAFIESGPIEMSDNDKVMLCKEFTPDVNTPTALLQAEYTVELTGMKYPVQPTSENTTKTLTFKASKSATDGNVRKANTRISGRLLKFKINIPSSLQATFEIGTNKIDVIAKGSR